jgi:hypothetical protein
MGARLLENRATARVSEVRGAVQIRPQVPRLIRQSGRDGHRRVVPEWGVDRSSGPEIRRQDQPGDLEFHRLVRAYLDPIHTHARYHQDIRHRPHLSYVP